MGSSKMTPERKSRLEKAVAKRQFGLTVILENVHDPHNIGAVLRSCDSVGVQEVFVLYNEPQLQMEYLKLGKRTTAGTRKWIDVRFYTDTVACFQAVRTRYDRIYGTRLGVTADDLYELDLTQNVALLFGNEMSGLTDEAMGFADGNFIIPQVGMAKSLNISVACAVSLYEAFRQRRLKGMYEPKSLQDIRRATLLENYLQIHASKNSKAKVRRIDP